MPCEASRASTLPVQPETVTPPPATGRDVSSCMPCEKTVGINTSAAISKRTWRCIILKSPLENYYRPNDKGKEGKVKVARGCSGGSGLHAIHTAALARCSRLRTKLKPF